MRIHPIIGAAIFCAFMAMPALAAADNCCNHEKKGACCEDTAMPCCKHDNDPAAEAVLIPQPGHTHGRPTREQMLVTFRNPVRVGNVLLMGKYVIEHDTERMANGEPCTHIYEFGSSIPAVTFHCVHLDRPYTERPTVTLRRVTDGSGLQILTEFQLKGESAGHGVPAR